MMNLLSRKEAAIRLCMSINTFDAERSGGRITYIQRAPGKKVWIPETAVAEYFERMTHPAKAEVKFTGSTYRKRRSA